MPQWKMRITTLLPIYLSVYSGLHFLLPTLRPSQYPDICLATELLNQWSVSRTQIPTLTIKIDQQMEIFNVWYIVILSQKFSFIYSSLLVKWAIALKHHFTNFITGHKTQNTWNQDTIIHYPLLCEHHNGLLIVTLNLTF